MPKELKKRGRRAEKQHLQQQISDEPSHKRRKTDHEDTSFTVDGNAGDDFISFGQENQDEAESQETTFYGLLTDEEQEYYASVNNKISSDDFEDNSDRANFIEAVYRETAGKEIKIASSQSCSRYLEKIIRLSNPTQLRSLFVAFLEDLDYLVQHRFGSHCTETLFFESAKYVESKSKSNEDGSPSFESLFLEAVEKLQPNSGFLLTERFASHVIRVLLLVLSGQNLEDSVAKTVVASRKKEHIEITQQIQAADVSRKVPKSFQKAWRQLVKSAVSGLDPNYLRALATSPTGNPVLQLLLQLELTADDSKEVRGDFTVLEKLVPDQEFDPESQSSKFVAGLIYDSTGAYLVQCLVKYLPGKTFKKLYRNLFKERVGKLAKNEIASYVAVSIFERVGKDDLAEAMEALLPEIPGLVERNRLAVLRSLTERCEIRGVDLEPVQRALIQVYGQDASNMLMTLLKFSPPKEVQDGANEKERAPTSAVDLQGSLFAQGMLRTKGLGGLIQDGLLAQDEPTLSLMAKAPISSRVIQAALTSDASPPKFLRQFVPKFYDAAADLAIDVAGSHVVDALWKATSGSHFMKERIANSLIKQEAKIRDSIYGRTVWKNWSMDIYQSQPREWQAIAKGLNRDEGQQNEVSTQKKTPIELARERHLQKKARMNRQPLTSAAVEATA